MFPPSPTGNTTTLPLQIKEETTWGYPPEEVKNALCAAKANDQIRLDLCHNPAKRSYPFSGEAQARRDPFATRSLHTNSKVLLNYLIMWPQH